MTLHDAAKFVATHGAPELLPAGLQNNLALASCANELDRAFRAASLVLHPDHGGNATDFATLVVARDLLRAAASR
jgi:citrate synthase